MDPDVNPRGATVFPKTSFGIPVTHCVTPASRPLFNIAVCASVKDVTTYFSSNL